MASRWSVSTDAGSSLSGEQLVGVLSTHHDRVLNAWQGFSAEDWEKPSRNALWSVHETARHVADAMESCSATVHGEPSRFGIAEFDARTTPSTWLAQSLDDPPDRTIERFANAAGRLRVRVGERVAAGDASVGEMVYGPAHWSVGVVHVFWDSWLHERDVLVPLDLSAECSVDERRLVGLYSLLISMVPARLMEQPIAASVHFTGPSHHGVAAAHAAGRVVSAETDVAETELTGDLCAVVDSLAGRGRPLSEVLSGAPDLLGVLADFFTR